MSKLKRVSLKEGLLLLLAILVIMGVCVIGFKIPPEVPILISIMIIIAWAKARGTKWKQIDQGFVSGVKDGIVPFLIFILIGALIGIWIASGVIPSLMVFGFHLISVRWFLPSAFIVTAIVGSFIGSAFTVISTLGVAFMGMGLTMHIDPAMVAGAVLCGAIFGDKSSPLSATDNLSAAVVGADLMKHIKNLMWSTIPALVGSFILFCLIGRTNHSASLAHVHAVIQTLDQHFSVTWWAIVPVALLCICAWGHVPTVSSLFINILVSSGMLTIEHPHFGISKWNDVLVNGFKSTTGNHTVDTLLSRGGINNMMGTLSLVLIALALGGLLSHLGVIRAVMIPLSRHMHSTGALITAVICSGIGVNFFIGEQYLSVVLPASAFNTIFKKRGLAPVALSRALEDGGTVINYLIPWGVAGAFVSTTLNISPFRYVPFVFFSLLSPIFSIISGFTGIGIKRLKNHQ